MKQFIYILIILGGSIVIGCSSDDDNNGNNPQEEVSVVSLRATSISFKHANGTSITANECLNPEDNFAIEIEVQRVGSNEVKPTQIQYTINGTLHSMTFLNSGIKSNPVEVVEGLNNAQLVDSGVSDEVSFVFQGDFQIIQ